MWYRGNKISSKFPIQAEEFASKLLENLTYIKWRTTKKLLYGICHRNSASHSSSRLSYGKTKRAYQIESVKE